CEALVTSARPSYRICASVPRGALSTLPPTWWSTQWCPTTTTPRQRRLWLGSAATWPLTWGHQAYASIVSPQAWSGRLTPAGKLANQYVNNWRSRRHCAVLPHQKT